MDLESWGNCTIRVAKSVAVTAKLICAFVFAYADCWFSHATAHLNNRRNMEILVLSYYLECAWLASDFLVIILHMEKL